MLGCEYGDHNPRHCEGHRRSDCYDSSYRGRCCDTCSRYEPGPAGCEFGDRAQFCANQEPSDCYNNKNTCCETCRRVVTGPTGKTLVTQTRQMLNISLPILAAFFPGKTGLANFTEAKEDENGGNNWSYKSYKAPVKLSPPTNHHPAFYKPDALPVAQPAMSEHRRESKL